jgi:aminopeptidase N
MAIDAGKKVAIRNLVAIGCAGMRAGAWRGILGAVCVVALLVACAPLRADEPYARSRDYNLEHSRIELRFDTAQKKVIGDVTHTVSIFQGGTTELAFDSAGLNIESVTVDKKKATFEVKGEKLDVTLPEPAKAGETLEVEIRYEGKPTKGMYFILPDKDYPNQPVEVWTQGESEDTHFYLPTYDYPNDRLTTETILTAPATWVTVANGKLLSVKEAGNGMKTWTWKESLPSSTYLTTVVAGEFDEVKDSWHGIPVTYYAPKGEGDRLKVNYGRTPEMLEFFSKMLGVEYPWEKYSQAMVDQFVAGGMENSSATTNTSLSLRDARLVPEFPTDEDGLISHELGHQWFGDTVTCKDWGDIWLNEGFATFMAYAWMEHYYPKDQADYQRWMNGRGWFKQENLYEKPIVRFDFTDSSEFDGNAYTKGGWVLYMLRHQIGEQNFYAGLKHYLEVNRGKNVVTADLVKAIEEATHINVDQFFDEWVYGAGAPKFDLSYAYDAGKHQVTLDVKQTQEVEGDVGLFTVPVDVQITTASGAKDYPITVSKADEDFTFPADSAPLMVLFDKGGQVLKSANFHKDEEEWLYQLKNATEFADRADAVEALGALRDDDAVAALGEAMTNDKSWGIRAEAASALGKMKTAAAEKQLLKSLADGDKPWVRSQIIEALGNFKETPELTKKLIAIAKNDKQYRSRAAALEAIGKMKAPDALETLTAATEEESPDGFLRDAALAGLGSLGDAKAVPTVEAWTEPGKEFRSRAAAIRSLAQLKKDDKELTQKIASYLNDPNFRIRFAAIFALGARGDASAIPALEAMLKSKDLSIDVAPLIKRQIALLKKGPQTGAETESGEGEQTAMKKQLEHVEKLVEEMNQRLKAIEERLPAKN